MAQVQAKTDHCSCSDLPASQDRETGLLGGQRWGRSPYCCMAQGTTTWHLQVPVLDVELLHLERQASGMSLSQGKERK